MRVLPDEGVAHALARALTARNLPSTAFPNDWKGLRNGRLIARAAAQGFTVLLTNDRNLFRQHNLASLPLAIVNLPTSRPKIVIPRADDITDTIRLARSGECVQINFDGSRQRFGRSTEPLPSIRPFDQP